MIRYYFGLIFRFPWVEQAGDHTCVPSSENIGGEAVSDDDGLICGEVLDGREASVEEEPVGLVCAEALGDEYLLEISADARAADATVLHLRRAVRYRVERVFAAERLEHLERSVDERAGERKAFYVYALGLCRRDREPELAVKLLEAAPQQLRAGYLAAL